MLGSPLVLQAVVAVADRQKNRTDRQKNEAQNEKVGFSMVLQAFLAVTDRQTPARHPRDTRRTAKEKSAPRLPVDAFLLVLLLFKSLTTTRTLKSHDC